LLPGELTAGLARFGDGAGYFAGVKGNQSAAAFFDMGKLHNYLRLKLNCLLNITKLLIILKLWRIA
jgi:hypothetical protein